MQKEDRKRKWVNALKILLEGLGIIVSIIIAFAIENWDEDQKKMEKENFYLQSVYSDLNKDFLELNRRVDEYSQKMAHTEELLFILQGENFNQESVITIINKHLTYNFPYIPFNHTYKALESSGDIKLIRNEELKLLFFELDKSFYSTTLYGDRFLDFMNSTMWAGYLLENVDYNKRQLYHSMAEDVRHEREFYSRAKRLYELMETYYYNMQGTLLKVEDVRAKLEVELKEKHLSYETLNIEENKQDVNTEEEELEDLLDDL